MIPNVRRTWAPRGQTPIIRHRYTRDKISAISAVTVSAERHRVGFYMHLHPDDNITSVEVAVFLRALLRHLRGHVIVVLDRGSIHKGPDVRELLARCPRLHLEWFPGYAPDLNPAEQVWNDFKRHTANSLLRNKQDIRLNLHASTRRVRRSGDKLRSFVLSSDLPSAPWQ